MCSGCGENAGQHTEESFGTASGVKSQVRQRIKVMEQKKSSLLIIERLEFSKFVEEFFLV